MLSQHITTILVASGSTSLSRTCSSFRGVFTADLQQGASEAEQAVNRALLRRIHEGDLWSLLLGFFKFRSVWQLVHTIRVVLQLPEHLPADLFTVAIPEHVSSEEQVDSLVAQLLALLRHSHMKPVVVTIARSVGSGFAPAATARLIECKVLAALSKHFGAVDQMDVRLHDGSPISMPEHCHPDETNEKEHRWGEAWALSTVPESGARWWLVTALYTLVMQLPILVVGHTALLHLNRGKKRAPWAPSVMCVSQALLVASALVWALAGCALLWVWWERPSL